MISINSMTKLSLSKIFNNISNEIHPDLKYFMNKLYGGLGIPESYLYSQELIQKTLNKRPPV